jgi:hypothetical protein
MCDGLGCGRRSTAAALPNRLRRITIDQRGWGRSESHSRASSSRILLLMRRKLSKRLNLIDMCLSAIPGDLVGRQSALLRADDVSEAGSLRASVEVAEACLVHDEIRLCAETTLRLQSP